MIGLICGVVVGLASRSILGGVFSFLVTSFVTWMGLPTLAYGFDGLSFVIMLNGIIAMAVAALKHDDRGEPKVFVLPGILVGIGFVSLFILPIITSAPIFHADAYKNIIGDIKESNFSTDVETVDPSQVRIVDDSVAYLLAEKKLGDYTALGSQVELGKLDIQSVRGKLYWVGPLNHSGFFKWLNSPSGTPGYVMVSATDEEDVQLVEKINGKNIQLKYNEGSYWGDDIHRYLYNHGYSTTGLTDFSFEIDDFGNPYWIITKYVKRVGFSGNDAVGVIVLNAQTGEIKDYSTTNAPRWIDRIQPDNFVEEQLDDWGDYVHGWWNFSGKDKLETTNGISLVYGADGKSYWYQGMSSKGKDNSTVGFILVNSHTKEAHLYKLGGATESAARESAEGAVQQMGYKASHAILYNVGGTPTYFMTLKDAGGLVKSMAFVAVQSYQTVGVGEDVETALRAYHRALASRGNTLAPDAVVQKFESEGQVLRIGNDGKGNFYLVIDGVKNKAFAGGANLSIELPLTQVGDHVSVTYNDGGNSTVDMTGFDNLNLSFQVSSIQQKKTLLADSVRSRNEIKQQAQNADATWENLSEADKAKAVSALKDSSKK